MTQSVYRLGYELDDRGIGFHFRQGEEIYYLIHSVQTGSGTHPASFQQVSTVLSSGIKQWVRGQKPEADHLPPSEGKNACSYTSTLPRTASWLHG
jgi:hypothetical protein